MPSAQSSPRSLALKKSARRKLLLESIEDRILCSAAPQVTISAPANPKIGESIPVTVSFNNATGTNPGFGPYVDLVMHHATGVTGTGGGVDFVVGTNTATYLGTPITTTKLTFQAADAGHPTGPYAIHPYGKDAAGNPLTVYAPAGYGVGDTLLVLQLPFGSFTTTQPAAPINLDLKVSNLAELNRGLNISARGGFQYGNDALDNPTTDPSIVGGYQSTTVTPKLLTLTKTYLGPEDETATGPNFIRQYRIDVDIAPGQTVTNLQLSDLLPGNMQFANGVQVQVHGVATGVFATPNTPSTSVPGGTLTRTITIPAGVTGDATGAADATLIFSYYIPRIDAGSAVVVPAGTGAANTATDTASAQGNWNPLDPGDPQNITATAAPASHTLNVKSIATQKSVAIVTDTGAAGATPGDTLEYTIDVQVSDYFAFQNLLINDTFSDGQRLDLGFTPTFTWTEHGATFSAQNFNGASYTVTPHYSAGDGNAADGTDGTTGLLFNLSAEMVARGQDAKLLGGGIPNAGTGAGPLPNQPPLPFGATTVTVKFRTVIQNAFSDNIPSGNPKLNPRDVLTNAVSVSGDVLNVTNVTALTGGTASDSSTASVAIINSTVTKSIYAINGLLSTDPSFATRYIGPAGQYLVSPGDTVTYRLDYYLPTGDVENLTLTDFLPLPVFNATEITTFDDVISAVTPVAGHAKFGATEGIRPLHGSAPTITTDAAGNSVLFNYGTTDNPLNDSKHVDILFTVTTGSQAFADGLFLTNQVRGSENNTQQPATPVSSDAIIQFQIEEPIVTIAKGVVGYNSTGLTLGGISFTNPTLGSSFTGTVSNAAQAAAIGASDALAAGLDGGDKVRYAVVLQNTGRNDAYDLQLGDAVPAGYAIPASVAAMGLTVRRGDGTLLKLGADYTATISGGGALSIQLTDNYSSGNTGSETGTGALSRGFNANNATVVTNGSNTVVITYDLTLQTGVAQAGSTITNTASLNNYAGSEGGTNFIPTPLTDAASITLARPTLTKVLSGTEINATGNNAANQAVVGELVTYTLTLTVPEGQTPNAVLTDVLDAGLAFVSVQSATLSGGLTSSNPIGTGTAPANVAITGSGHNLAFNFGTLTNSNSSNGAAETISIVYRAVVLNQNTAPAAPGNQAGTLLNNAASFSAQFTNVPAGVPTAYSFNQTAPTPDVTVVEPALTVTKDAATAAGGPFTASLTNVDGGDTIFYRVRIVNAAGAPTAFGTTLSDLLPAFFTSPAIFSVSGGGFTAADFTITGSTLQTANVGGLDIAANTTLDIIVQGTLSTTVAATQAFTNTANVQWTSMSGTPGTRSIYNAGSTERTGAGGVGTDTAVLNNYAAATAATVTGNSPAVDKRFQGGSLTADDTSVATAGGNALDRVVVGESVIYDMLVTLPEGVSQSLAVDDLLPPGMRLDLTFNGGLGYQIIAAAASSNGQLSANFSNPGALAPTLAAVNGGTLGLDGTDARLTFGNVTVTADNVANNNAFLIRVRAIVDDVIGNQGGTTLNNAAQISFTNPNTGGTTTATDATPNDHIVTVIEPTLAISKTASAPFGDAGDPVNYTITFNNPAGANAADAYDVRFADSLPADIVAPAISLVPADFSATGFGGFIAPTVNDFEIVNLAGTNVLRLKLAVTLHVPVGASVSLKVGGALSNTVASGQTISNTATTNWTSTPGANADERDGSGIPSPTLTAPDVAILNNYSIASTAVSTVVASPVVSKVIFSTSEASTTDNLGTGLHNVAPGEIVTYRVTVALPEGATPSFKILDNIPAGMAYVPGSVLLFAAHPGGADPALNAAQPGVGTAAFNGGGLAAPAVSSSPVGGNPFTEGTDVQFDFGSLTTTGDNDTNNNTFYFTYQAVVLDVAGNVGLQGTQVTRTNAVTFTVNGGASTAGVIDPGGTTATLVEPHLGVNKTVTIGGGSTGDAGDTLNYSAIISHQADSLANAFETTFSDALPPEIATPGAFTVTHSVLGDISGRFEIVGNVLRTIAGQSFDLALGQTVTVAFTSTLTSAVTPNETIDSTAAIAYTGLPGDKNSPAYNPTADVATDHERSYVASDNGPVTVPVATLTKTLFATSDANTAGANLGIGETATYALRVTLPEGTTPNLSVVDLLPAGMQYVSSSVVTTAAASGGLLAADFGGTVPAPTITGGAANGDDVTFTFGAIKTTGDNAISNNSFLIFITARVLDVVGNVGTTPGQSTLDNAATLDITGDGAALFTTPNVTATVVEPRLQITKAASDTTPDAGQTLTYTLTISHTASSTAIAYDVLLRDAIPGGITLDTGSILVNGVAAGVSSLVDSDASTGSLLDLKFTQLAVGGTITVSYTATITTNPAIAGANLDNNAKIYWDTDPAEDPNTVLSGGSDGTPDRDLGATPGVEAFNVNTDPAQDTERVTVNASIISGFVYHAANADGSFGGPDTGIVGATVALNGTDLNGNIISRTTTTIAGGAYSFTNLTAGVYTITETQPAGFTDAIETVGSLFGGSKSDALGSDTISSVTIPVQTSATGASYNFGEVRASSIAGSVFSDVNNDGIRQGGETGIATTPVRLTGTDVFGQGVLLNGTTDVSGNYFFDNSGVGLRPGTYVVREMAQPAGFLDGRDTAGTSGGNAILANDQISALSLAQNTAATGYVFGELNPAALSGFVYYDANNDGIKQGGEIAIVGATVTLTGTDDLGTAFSIATATDGAGAYTFTNLRPGNYVLKETQPAGFLDGKDTLGTGLSAPNGAGTVGADQFTNVVIVNVAAGNNAGSNYNFGEVLATRISGRVFSDLNNDGLENGADAAIAGVTITLTGLDDIGNAVNVMTTTNGSGDYTFAGLRPSGVAGYTITETQPAPFLDGRDTAGSAGGVVAAPPSDAISGVVLVPNANSTGNNFAELIPAGLSGFVYADTNNDGVKQGGESGIVGATVTLSGTDDLGNAVNLTMASNGAGAYSFANVRPGNYVLTETQPSGFLDGKDTLGTGLSAPNSAGVTGADTFTAISLVDLTPGNNAGTNYNFGELAPNSLAGRVFSDVNNDGVQNGADAGIGGVTIALSGTDDLSNAVNLTTATVGTGDYSFANLRPGNYVLTETQPVGFLDGKNIVGTQGGSTVNIPPSDTITAIVMPLAGVAGTANNFAELAPAGIAGFVYSDANNDGVKQGGESGIGGVTVTLTGTDDLGNAVNLTTATLGSGAYSFTNVRPSDATGYTITETQPGAFLDGRDTIGTPGGTVANDVFSNIVLTAGTASANNNFGELVAASLSGIVFDDLNNDGVKQGGESGIGGVTVALTGTDDLGNAVNTIGTTLPGGTYSFANLRPGTYTITETQPGGFFDGRETVGSQLSGTVNNAANSNTISAITLTAGTAGAGNNFGELTPASLAGIVFDDRDNDGNVDPGENGIGNATVTLTGTDDRGNAVNTATVTLPDGTYIFSNLRPGTYTITETQPAGFLDGIDNAGTLGGSAAVNDVISGIVLGAAQAGTNNRFGELMPSSLSGVVFSDLSNDGAQNPGEPGIGGVTVTVTGTDDRGSAVNTPGTTLADGTFTFGNLRPGAYTITETQPGTFLDGIDTAGTLGGSVAVNDRISGITVAPAQGGTGNRFGEIAALSLGGNVFTDSNNDGIFGGGETGIAGVTVVLTGTDDLGNPVSLTTATLGDGSYTFTGMRPSNGAGYTVTETQPAGFLDGRNAAGSEGGATVNNPPSDVISGIVMLVANTTATAYNFGELQPASIGGRVFQDINQDGSFNGPDSGIAGVSVTLTGTDDLGNAVNLVTTTNPSGAYSFGNLRPGTYAVTETQPAAFADGADTVGSAGGVNAANDVLGGIVFGSGTNATGYTFAEISPFAPTKTIVSTSNPGNVGTNLSIGEIVRYHLVLALPDGTLPSLVLEDQLPAGLVFLDDGAATLVLVSLSGTAVTSSTLAGPGLGGTDSSAAPTFVLPGAAISSSLAADVDAYASGTHVFFKLGDVTNTETNVAGGEFAVIELNARVANIPSNRLGTPLDNTFRPLFDLDANGTPDVPPGGIVSNPAHALVAEPVLFLDKQLTVGSATPRQDDILTFTVTIGHATGSNATAWEAAFSDVLPNGLQLEDITTGATGGAAITQAAKADVQGALHGQFDIPVGGQIVITYRVKVNVPPGIGTTLVNGAEVTWTSLPGDSPVERHGGDSLLGGDGLHDYGLHDEVAVTPFNFAFDSFNNFSGGNRLETEDYGIHSPDIYRQPLLPLAPIYSGEADPGSTLVLTLFNAKGDIIGTQSVVVDAGGNWMANFPTTTIRDFPNSVQMTQSSAFYSLADPYGHNLRTYFSPVLNAGHFFFQELRMISEGSEAPLLGDLGIRNPIRLGTVKYGGELLGASGTPGGY